MYNLTTVIYARFTVLPDANGTFVRVYVDAVLNHMTRSFLSTTLGAAGSTADTVNMVYPGPPYAKEDFNQPNCTVTNYANATEVSSTFF